VQGGFQGANPTSRLIMGRKRVDLFFAFFVTV
jgi:hypothetical protein